MTEEKNKNRHPPKQTKKAIRNRLLKVVKHQPKKERETLKQRKNLVTELTIRSINDWARKQK